MKKLIVLLLSSLLVLGACGEKKEESIFDPGPKEDKKEKKETKKEDKEKNDSKDKETTKESEPKTEEESTEENTSNEQESSNEQELTSSIDYNNITDRNSLVQILNGNYTEEQKIIAYNSAVSNGVIPQGNVLEGPAQAAYESSLRVESGQEKSIYDEQANEDEEETYDYENNGVYRTAEEQAAHEEWVNGQDEWNNATEAQKEEIMKRDAEKYGYEYDSADNE
ncbi:hypothetical protein RM648_01060 [Mammaliicoccus sciuri]|uniref:hypothetical protein n=1 Tax=Mammaliicoccus sciuri TaxID=1296 RepID=UPI0018CA47E1|nr:hypothetical protein [Mammaliicoccus sciuri]MBG9209487.1 hypothetical protein [Mammaliicoccus sciuri]MCI8456831.1 hypothetical protein [Mammaliicoccus sciuri]MDT0743839.1 hypothetical protein [Mammaliicoccus sciuri]MDT0751189.1 hypothetical protein [Mammaliicoccus sciuri]WQK60018.1 hypothetical protein P3U10_11020 [Mammaliicoccus sciuri]